MEIKNDNDLASFIEYSCSFLKCFARDVRETGLINMDIKDLRQIKGLLKLDNFALSLAAEYGVHPTTGLLWHVKFNGIDAERYQMLIIRNFELIEMVNEILRKLENE